MPCVALSKPTRKKLLSPRDGSLPKQSGKKVTVWNISAMPAKDKFHIAFVHALEKDGWTVTDDPLTIRVLDADLLIDIGAERMVGAERDGERIAVEIKSFISKSAVQDLKEAAG
jgi:hypothetical protein